MPEPTELEQPDAAQEDAAPKKSKGMLRFLLLMLPVILVPASAGAYLAFDYYPDIARRAVSAGLAVGLKEEAPEEEKPQEFGQFKVLTDLLVNPAGSNGKRFLMLNLGLEAQNTKVFEEIDLKDTVVRDRILHTLGQRTVEDLATIEGREALKEELRQTINSVLQKGTIDRLYFTQYVLQ